MKFVVIFDTCFWYPSKDIVFAILKASHFLIRRFLREGLGARLNLELGVVVFFQEGMGDRSGEHDLKLCIPALLICNVVILNIRGFVGAFVVWVRWLVGWLVDRSFLPSYRPVFLPPFRPSFSPSALSSFQ